jgi:cytochrome c oxidase cbb3-type subunit 3
VTTSAHPGSIVETTAEPAPEKVPEGSLLEHEYDGIREYDNPLPGWWVAVYWATVVFSIAYSVWYHVTPHGTNVVAAYEDEMRAAREARAKQSLAEAPSEAVLGKLMADAELMRDAKVTFGQRCAVCHAAEGQGLIGPNLTDAAWIHGDGTAMAIFEIVSHGVPSKGMPAWELQLQPIEVRKLAALVATMRGKNLPGKPPEGRDLGKQ